MPQKLETPRERKRALRGVSTRDFILLTDVADEFADTAGAPLSPFPEGAGE